MRPIHSYIQIEEKIDSFDLKQIALLTRDIVEEEHLYNKSELKEIYTMLAEKIIQLKNIETNR